MLLSLCCSVVIILYCYCVAFLLFVLSYVLVVCTVPLPPGVNPIAVDKYIYLSNKLSFGLKYWLHFTFSSLSTNTIYTTSTRQLHGLAYRVL